MNLIQNFFCALSECFCEIFPETLVAYKSLLTFSVQDQEFVEHKFRDYIVSNRDALVSKNVHGLPCLVFDDKLPPVDLASILCHPQGQANSDIIWDHIFVIIKFLVPDTLVSITPAPCSATDFVTSMVAKVESALPHLDSKTPPEEIFKTIANSDILPELFAQFQTQLKTRPDLSPANLIMAAAQLLLSRQSE